MQNDIIAGTVVTTTDGIRGTVASNLEDRLGTDRLVVEFEDGSRLVVPSTLLSRDSAGAYHLDVNLSAGADERVDEMVIPIIEEQLTVAKELVRRGIVRVNKNVEEFEQVVDLETYSENVTVERVEINRLLDDEDMPQAREEDGVLIIPLIEEVQVIETRYMLREEVRITKQRTTTRTPESVILRREVVDIEREAPDGTIVTESVTQAD